MSSIQSNTDDFESDKIQLRICINEKTENDAVQVAIDLQKRLQNDLEKILSKETDGKENVKVNIRSKLSSPSSALSRKRSSKSSLKTRSRKLSSLTENLRKSLQISGKIKSPLYEPCSSKITAATTPAITNKVNNNSGKAFSGVLVVPLNAMDNQQREQYKFEVKNHQSPIISSNDQKRSENPLVIMDEEQQPNFFHFQSYGSSRLPVRRNVFDIFGIYPKRSTQNIRQRPRRRSNSWFNHTRSRRLPRFKQRNRFPLRRKFRSPSSRGRRNTPIKMQSDQRSESSTSFCSLNTCDMAEEELRQPWIQQQSPTYHQPKSNYQNVDTTTITANLAAHH
ncbi:uncharacterized protein LOC124491377 [Dermatophagoides farinae]|uniref:Uncharacterized protein n=1 Tax=Dermatophagoides farinae TaxID=6954 RepID=A0A922IAT4_DERFA|nr:uncharacterized protein LOC124491377 [Dermatophagoides farinae]KAH7641119.1 hypothetical protein HUG17_4163 [Dermatophagoides farinae]KAH9526836.1 hypothetical protein DERF_000894 [Dermatophagoides farinae]